MKIIIAGSRYYKDYREFRNKLENLLKEQNLKVTKVVSGGAKGVDKMGEKWAQENNIPCDIYPANWEQEGKSAGPNRNEIMADKAEALIAFPTESSKGTYDMIHRMKARGLPVYEIKVET